MTEPQGVRYSPPTRHPLCKYLGCKKFDSVADIDLAELDDLVEGNFQQYWCVHTFTDTGPDDGYVEYERCRPGRSCFVPRGADE